MTETDRRNWLQARRSGIGSSDAPEVIGVGWSGKDGPGRVYRSKVGPIDTRPPEGILRRGLELEPVVSRMYEEVMGTVLATIPMVRHPGRPWQLASNDRRRTDNSRKVELKTTTGFGDGWGEQGSADIPDRYRVQVQHQMGVSVATDIDLFALDVISWKTRLYRIDFDRDYFQWLTEVQARFMNIHVSPQVEPGPEWLASLGPSPVPVIDGEAVDLGDDWAALIEARESHKRDRDAADEQYDAINRQLMAVMGSHKHGVAGRWRLRRTEIAGAKVSYDREPYIRLDVRAGK